MSMQNMVFRCDSEEKNKFQVEAEGMGLDASFLLRRMVHLFLCDRYLRERVLNLQCEQQNEEEWRF